MNTVEDHNIVDAVEEFWAEVTAQYLEHFIVQHRQVITGKVHNHLRANIARHDDNGVTKVDRPALAISQTAVVQHLEEHIKDVGVGLLDFIKQHHAVGATAHCFGELSAVVVANVAWWRANQPGDGVPLQIFAHINADHGVLVVK